MEKFYNMKCFNKDRGFTLVELLIVSTLLIIVLAIVMSNFTTILSASKGQAKIAETEMEYIIGLEILRQDLENAGYFLPWYIDSNDWTQLLEYKEAEAQTICGTVNIIDFDDAPDRAPRAIISGNNACGDGSDYLVIKSPIIRFQEDAGKWTYLINDNGIVQPPKSWPAEARENMSSNTKVIAISEKGIKEQGVKKTQRLITFVENGSRKFYTSLSAAVSKYGSQLGPNDVFYLVGIGPDSALRMPFNRADYFISRGSNVPRRCAQGTGVLVKGVLSHETGTIPPNRDELLDCVADFQVVFGVDITTPDPDGGVDCYTNDLSIFGTLMDDAEDIRERVREIRVYILSHEGQMDRGFRFRNNVIRVGDNSGLNRCDPSVDNILGRDYDLTAIPDWQHYRWKVYNLIVSPDNLTRSIRDEM